MTLYRISDSEQYPAKIENILGTIYLTRASIERLAIDEELSYASSVKMCDLDTLEPIKKNYVNLFASVDGFIDLGFTIQSTFKQDIPTTKRWLYVDLMKYLLNDKLLNYGCILYGTRRTGKTVLLQQAARTLTEKGFRVVIVTIKKDGINGDTLCSYLNSLFELGIDYVFVDEFTYAVESLNGCAALVENAGNKKLVLAATDSLMLRELTKSILFERVCVLRTTYISFKEFHSIYPALSAIDYLRTGSVMRSSQIYEQQHVLSIAEYKQLNLEYVGSAIIDNVINCFNRFDLTSRYPFLSALSDTEIRTLLFKIMQKYCEIPTLRYLRKKIKSKDLGNLKDVVGRKYNYFFDEDTLRSLEEEVEGRLKLADAAQFKQEHVDEIFNLFRDLDCIVEFNSQYALIPVAIRYAYACDCIISLSKFLAKQLQPNEFNLVDAQTIIQNCVEGELLESIINLDSIKRGLHPYKLRINDTIEVDMILGDTAYEIKRSINNHLKFARWLISDEVAKKQGINHLVILTNAKSETVQCSRQEIQDDINNSRKGGANIVLPGNPEEMFTIQFQNVSEFLLR